MKAYHFNLSFKLAKNWLDHNSTVRTINRDERSFMKLWFSNSGSTRFQSSTSRHHCCHRLRLCRFHRLEYIMLINLIVICLAVLDILQTNNEVIVHSTISSWLLVKITGRACVDHLLDWRSRTSWLRNDGFCWWQSQHDAVNGWKTCNISVEMPSPGDGSWSNPIWIASRCIRWWQIKSNRNPWLLTDSNYITKQWIRRRNIANKQTNNKSNTMSSTAWLSHVTCQSHGSPLKFNQIVEIRSMIWFRAGDSSQFDRRRTKTMEKRNFSERMRKRAMHSFYPGPFIDRAEETSAFDEIVCKKADCIFSWGCAVCVFRCDLCM